MKLFALLTILISIGCSTTTKLKLGSRWETNKNSPIIWAFNCDFPDDYKDDVREGFNDWDSLTSYKLFVEFKECVAEGDFPGYIIVNYSDEEGKKTDTGRVLGWARRWTYMGNITKVKILFHSNWKYKPRFTRRATSTHEVGHALGLSHDPNQVCIMYFQIETRSTKKNFCKEEVDKFYQGYRKD